MSCIALTMAGSDPSGGAGVQADLKTFHQHGAYGMAVLTLLTVQNTRGVERVRGVETDFVLGQLDAVLDDVPPHAAKTGALGSVDVISAVADRARSFSFPLVVDPVMRSKHGQPLVDGTAGEAMAQELVPRATLVTPNVHEAEALSGMEIHDRSGARRAAEAIGELGPSGVIVKGGHLEGRQAVDVMWWRGTVHELTADRVETRHTHGTGCAYSSAITAHLAAGMDPPQAARRAKDWLTEALRSAPGVGHGIGPPNHHTPVHRER